MKQKTTLLMRKIHVKHILKQIRKSFDISDTIEQYEELCECIYYSDCNLSYEEFGKLKKLVY